MHISNLVETKNLWKGALDVPAVRCCGAEAIFASIGEPFQ